MTGRAVPIGPAEYFDPHAFVAQAGPDSGALAEAFRATVLIPARATGVIVSPEGHVITAAHVIKDLYIGPTEDCPRLAIYLGHEFDAEGVEDAGLRRLPCERVIAWEFSNDFALFQVKVPEGMRLPYARIETDPSAIAVGMRIIAAGHPNASHFDLSHKKISAGEVAVHEPENEELPHFLHLADTDGGHSGGPLFSEKGKLVGIHIRGVPYYSNGVPGLVGGMPAVLKTFNLALPLPDLMRKFGHLISP